MKKILALVVTSLLITSQAFAVDIKAKRVAIDDTGNYLTATNVEDAIQETQYDLANLPPGFSTSDARNAISESVTGLDYTSSTGVFSLTSGYLIPTIATLSGTNTGDQTSVTGNAGTATALATNGTNCSAGEYPLGINASGAVESCTDATTEITSALAAFTGSSNIVTLGAASGTSLNLSGLTASQILSTDASKNLTSLDTATYPSLTELSYVKGVTSAIQTQIGAKQDSDAELTALAGLTSAADKIPYFTGSGTAGLVTIGSGLSFSGGTLSASSAGDVESIGDCTTGACFDGTSGTTITFDTNGGTYGFDGTIAYNQTNNYWTFTNSGFDDAGSAYWPVVSFTGNGTNSFGYNHFKAKTAGNQLIVGSNHNGYGFIVAHDGVSNGGGLVFYQNTVYPTDVNGTSAAFINAAGATPTNNVIGLGDASYRWANIYSVAGNLSGALSFTDTGTYSQTGAITYGGSNNNWTLTAPGINDAGSGYPPAWLFTIHASSTGLNPAGIMKIEGGGQRNYPLYLGSSYKGGVVMGRQGSSTAQIGAGLSFGYGEGSGDDTNRTSIMPIRMETGEIADPTIVNNVVTLGSASYRFKNFYSVLGNFSGNVQITGASSSEAQIVVFDFATNTATGDGKFYFHIGERIGSANLTGVHAEVITAGTTGTTDIQIYNVDNAVDMLTTKLTVDSGETGSDTATAAVINTSNDDVDENDVLRIDVDAVSTTPAIGLIVTLEFDPR